MKKLIIHSLFFTTLSCSSNQVKTDYTSSENDPTLASFPIKPLQIVDEKESGFGADIRLSYVKSSSNGRSDNYKINATFEGKIVGFELFVPTNGSAKLTIKSSGTISDNFIQLLAKLYEVKIDSEAKFADLIRADCINMGDYIDGLNKQDQGNYSAAAQYKLFLKDESNGDSPSLFMNINKDEHRIEIGEKDIEYRQSILSHLTKKQ